MAGIWAVVVTIVCARSTAATTDSVLNELGARYVYRHWHVEIDGEKYTLVGKAKIDILNERGRAYARLSFSESNFSSVRSINAKLIDANGMVVTTRKKKDFNKVCGWEGYSLYADNCDYITDLSSPSYPYSIEYEYEISHTTLFHLFAPVFQSKIPVLEAEYILDTPADLVLSHKSYGIDLTPRVSSFGNRTVYTWRALDVPAFEDIDYVPPDARQLGKIELFPHSFELEDTRFEGNSWQAIGVWYSELFRPRYGQDVVEGPVSGISSTMDDLVRITDSITAKLRYVAIEVGIGGWQPSAVEETETRGYGDCKDMTAVLVTALRRSGIAAYPVMIRPRDHGPIDVDFPDIAFGHVICMAVIDADTIWIDPTCDVCAPGDLPYQDEDLDVLVVVPEGGVIRHTPTSKAEDNLVSRIFDITIHADRSVTFDAVLTYHGNHAQYIRRQVPTLSNDEKRQYVERRFDGGRKQVEIEAYEFSGMADVSQPVVLTVKGKGQRPITKLGDACYCRAFMCGDLNSIESTGLKDRALPLDMFYPDMEVDEVLITCADSAQVDSVAVPPADMLTMSFGSVELETNAEPRKAHLKLARTYTNDRILPDEFADFETFRQKLKSIYSTNVKLVGAH